MAGRRCLHDDVVFRAGQTADFAGRRARHGLPVTYEEIPGANHFTIMHEMMSPKGRITTLIRQLFERTAWAVIAPSDSHGEGIVLTGTDQAGRLTVQRSWAVASVHAVASGSSVIQVSASLPPSIR